MDPGLEGITMHGYTKKEAAQKTDEERRALDAKAAKYKGMADMLLRCKESGLSGDEHLEMTAKALRVNPDFYSIWNYRREILVERYGKSLGLTNKIGQSVEKENTKIKQENGGEVVATEFGLTSDAILKNPKSYGAWHHRQWIAQRFEYDKDTELALCRDFLLADQRNFHCWIYRSFIAHDSFISASSEFAFSTDKIAENFSNYSAFHYRSVYLLRQNMSGDALRTVLDGEFNLIENAIYTEPDDQSAWWYLQFLMGTCEKEKERESESERDRDRDRDREDSTSDDVCSYDGPAAMFYRSVVNRMTECVRALLDIEPECKWCLVALVELLGRGMNLVINSAEGEGMETRTRMRVERQGLLEKLKKIDPMHIQRYKYLLRMA